MLINTLKNYWFSEKEAKIYLSCLELWNAIVSSISRRAGEHRITTYSILKDLKNRWISFEITKNKVKYFSVITPEQLLDIEEKKVEKLKKVMPELLAISNAFWNKPKVLFYEGFEQVKDLFMEKIACEEEVYEPFLTFIWTQDIDERFDDFLKNEFVEYRKTRPKKTRAIVTKENSHYLEYHQNLHDTIIIDEDIFEMWIELVIFSNSIGIFSYKKDEIYGLIIESDVLKKALKSMFNLIWKAYKK